MPHELTPAGDGQLEHADTLPTLTAADCGELAWLLGEMLHAHSRPAVPGPIFVDIRPKLVPALETLRTMLYEASTTGVVWDTP